MVLTYPVPWGAILIALLALNGWTMHSFYADKMRSLDGRRRTPERHLLTLALFGGSIGALLGRRIFRHKTRKESFSAQLYAIVVLQLAAILLLAPRR